MEPMTAELKITFEDGRTITAKLDPTQAVKVLAGMKAGSVGRPLPDFKKILLSVTATQPA